MNCWETAQNQIEECRRCENDKVQYLVVPENKRHPSFPPPQSIRLLFISVAPPWGGSYFWYKPPPDSLDNPPPDDGLRNGLFRTLNEALKKTGQSISTLSEFRDQGYFLVPAVKCPSCKNGNDHLPASTAIKNCAPFLHKECKSLSPERILALGKIPMQSVSKVFNIKIPPRVERFREKTFWVTLGNREIPLMGTYFPGNNRHRGFEDIVTDIRQILSKSPRPGREESSAIRP